VEPRPRATPKSTNKADLRSGIPSPLNQDACRVCQSAVVVRPDSMNAATFKVTHYRPLPQRDYPAARTSRDVAEANPGVSAKDAKITKYNQLYLAERVDSNPRYAYTYNGFRVLRFSCWRVPPCS
jgi:hypothetical protein